jgi:hypothetical protein
VGFFPAGVRGPVSLILPAGRGFGTRRGRFLDCSGRSPRTAAQDSPYGEPGAGQDSVPANGRIGVVTAGGNEPALDAEALELGGHMATMDRQRLQCQVCGQLVSRASGGIYRSRRQQDQEE